MKKQNFMTEREEIYRLWEKDRLNLEHLKGNPPTHSMLISKINNWNQRRLKKFTKPTLPNLVVSNLVKAISFLTLVWFAILTVRGHLEVSSSLLLNQSKNWLAISMMVNILIWLFLSIHHWSWKIFFQKNLNFRTTIFLNIINALINFAGLALSGLISIPLIYFLFNTTLTRIQFICLVSIPFLIIGYEVNKIYKKDRNQYEGFGSWFLSVVQAKEKSRKQKVSLSILTILTLYLSAIFVSSLIKDDNNYQVTSKQTAVAENEDLTVPPNSYYNSPFGKTKFTFTSNTKLEQKPQSNLATYRQVVQSLDLQDAWNFAASFGFDSLNSKFEQKSNVFIFTKSLHATLVLSREVKGLWSYNYNAQANSEIIPGESSNSASSLNIGTKIDRATATLIAIKFLQKTQLFNITYQPISVGAAYLINSVSQNDDVQNLQLDFIQIKDGSPIYGPTSSVTLNSGGEILEAHSQILPLEKVGLSNNLPQQQIVSGLNSSTLLIEAYQLKFDKQIEGGGSEISYSFTDCEVLSNSPTTITQQTGPEYQVGQALDLSGSFNVTIYHDPNGQKPDHRVSSLSTQMNNTSHTFYLEGSLVGSMVALNGHSIELKGKVTQIMPQSQLNRCQQGNGSEHVSYKLEVGSYKVNDDEQLASGEITQPAKIQVIDVASTVIPDNNEVKIAEVQNGYFVPTISSQIYRIYNGRNESLLSVKPIFIIKGSFNTENKNQSNGQIVLIAPASKSIN